MAEQIVQSVYTRVWYKIIMMYVNNGEIDNGIGNESQIFRNGQCLDIEKNYRERSLICI